jgi:hypothetical protein
MQELSLQFMTKIAGGEKTYSASQLAIDIQAELVKGCTIAGTEHAIETDLPLIEFNNQYYTVYPLIDKCTQTRDCRVKYTLTCDMREINKQATKLIFDSISV